jgi:hypothetical protein
MRIQPSYNQSFTDPYSFQAQEHDDELKGDGNSMNFSFRMHDPRLGRFFAIDPLSNKYPWNSVYAFSENVVIHCLELEGLEKKLAIAMSGGEETHYSSSDINAFEARATNLEKKNGFTKISNVQNGDMLIDALKTETKSNGPILAIVTFAHSGSPGIFMDNNDGFYTSDRITFDGQKPELAGNNVANVHDLKESVKKGEVQFAGNAIWIFASCYTANTRDTRLDFESQNLASNVAYNLGIKTIGATGSVYPEIVNGKETGKLKTDGVFKLYIPKVTLVMKETAIGLKIPTIKKEVTYKELGNTIDPKDYIPAE